MDYISPGYCETKVKAKYIGYIGDTLKLYEVNDNNQTIKEARIKPENVPSDLARKARDIKGKAFNQVKIWSRDN